jgi:PAS domain S-box-containing protein
VNGAKEPYAWQETLIGAVFALVGAGIVELLLFVGETPLGPVGWPTLGAIFASALYGGRGLVGAAAVLFAYYVANALLPGRFPAFFASPVLTFAWVGAGGLICGLVLALRGRLMVALRAEGRETAAKEDGERFRQLTKVSSDWYWEQDDRFRFTFVSKSEHDHALDPGTLIGRHRWDFLAGNLSAADWAQHRALLERHEPFRNLVAERRDALGKRRWSAVSGDPVFDAAGRFRGYRGIGRDITAEKLAEQAARDSEARLRLLAGNLPALIGYVDSDERFRFHNLAYES